MTLLILRCELLLLDQGRLRPLVVLIGRIIPQLRYLGASQNWHQVALHQLAIDEGGWKRGTNRCLIIAARRC